MLQVAVLLAFALVVGALLARVEAPPAALVAVRGLVLLAVLALAIASLEAAVIVGVALIAAVKVEPAPADLMLGVAVLVALLTGRFDIGHVPVALEALRSPQNAPLRARPHENGRSPTFRAPIGSSHAPA